MIFEKCDVFICFISFGVVKRSPLKHHHNELYSTISKIEFVRKRNQELDFKFIVWRVLISKITSVFPGAKKRRSNKDDKHAHGLEKRKPST